MYQLALDKGVKDRDMILTRLGIAQVRAGQIRPGEGHVPAGRRCSRDHREDVAGLHRHEGALRAA